MNKIDWKRVYALDQLLKDGKLPYKIEYCIDSGKAIILRMDSRSKKTISTKKKK